MAPAGGERSLRHRIGSGVRSFLVLALIVVLFALVISRGSILGLGG